MFFQSSLLLPAALTAALAYPNVLPKHQQEIIQDPANKIYGQDNIYFTSTIRDVLLANQIIDQVLDDFEPTYYLDISYPKHHERVLLGNDIPVKAVSNRPVFTFHPLGGPPSYDDPHNEKNLTFTLILTDPDALSHDNPVKSEMCHWIMTNLTTPLDIEEIEMPEFDLDEEFNFDMETSASVLGRKPGEIESYQPPAPPEKTGPHRYVFVLLEGDASHLKAPKERPHWGYGKKHHGVRQWSAENNLTVVGANFFYAQHNKQ